MSASPERWAEGPTVLASVWRYRWLVLAVTTIMGSGGFLASQAQDEAYSATGVIYLANPETSGIFGQAGRTDLDRYLPQQAERATSTPVLALAIDELAGDISVGDLERSITVGADPELAALEITAIDGSAERSAAIVNAMIAAYQDNVQSVQMERTNRATEELERAADDIEARIAEVEQEADTAPNSELGVLSQRLSEIDSLRQQLEVDARLFGSGVEFVEEAEAPANPFAPAPRRTAAAMAVLGALLASALAYWLAGRGQRVSSRDEPGRVLGVPLLGVLPTYEPADGGTLRERTTLDPRTAEAYRFVQSSLDATLREIGASSVMITSASPSTGKTELTLQVAATAHRRGQAVLVIDADLRMRGLTSFLRAERSLGLRDLADRPRGTAADLIARYPLGDQGKLAVLTAGHVAQDGNEQLNETWFGPAFEELASGHALTLVDSAPLLAVADTAMIAGYTDAIVLVVREGSDLYELERVKERLQFVGRRLVGYVYLTPTALDDTAFDYGLLRAEARESLGTRRDPETHENPSPGSNGSVDSRIPATWQSEFQTSPTGSSRYPDASRSRFPSTASGAASREPPVDDGESKTRDRRD